MSEWIRGWAAWIGAQAPPHALELCRIPSLHADAEGAERALHALAGTLPAEAHLTRPDSSSPGFAPDFIARVHGHGSGRVLLLGHIDTVRADVERTGISGDHLLGPGAYDMKGGLTLAGGALTALASRPESFEHVDLLVVTDEEWREHPLVHAAGAGGRYDACLCFEGGEQDGPAVITRRKEAAIVRISARGRPSHAGSSPLIGRSALLVLSRLASELDITGPGGLVATPTMLRAGEAINTIPSTGELSLDVRAFDADALRSVQERVPPAVDGVALTTETVMRFPPMDTTAGVGTAIERATELIGGRAIRLAERGGSSDAAFLAAEVPVTVDGLGPVGSGDHGPEEHVLLDSFEGQAELALALALAALDAE